MKFYRKLKDYIRVNESSGVKSIRTVFGDLMSSNCIYCYIDEKTGKWTEYQYMCGIEYTEVNFLMNYYVKSIFPTYRVSCDRIVPLLSITLSKEVDELL